MSVGRLFRAVTNHRSQAQKKIVCWSRILIINRIGHFRHHKHFNLIRINYTLIYDYFSVRDGSNSKAMNRNWSNQKANPALKTKAGNK